MTNDVPDWTGVVARPALAAAGNPYAYINGVTDQTVTLDTDTHSLGIVITNPTAVGSIVVTGTTTGVEYSFIAPSANQAQGVFWVPVLPAIDAAVKVEVTASSTGQFWLTFVHDTQATVDNQQPGNFNVAVQVFAPVVHAILDSVGANYFKNTEVKCAQLSFSNPGQNATVTVIAAQGLAEHIYLHKMGYAWSAAPAGVFGNWIDGSGTLYGTDFAAAAGAWRFMDFDGLQLPVNTAFQFKQTGAGAANGANAAGFVTYTID